MIENKESYEDFYKEIENHDLILHIVPAEPHFHAAVCQPIAAFVYDVQTKRSYSISFNHPDIDFKLPAQEFAQRIVKQNNRIWAMDKKSLIQTLPVDGIYDINLVRFLKNNSTFDYQTETPAHNLLERFYPDRRNLNRIIPLVKHKEIFDGMVASCVEMIKTAEIDPAYNKVNTIILETLAELEQNGICIDKPLFDKCFGVRTHPAGELNVVYSQYNPYTSTGRPSNRFDGVNYAALKKDDGCRRCFVSRHNVGVTKRMAGKMLLIDYSAFHPRIISYLIGFKLPVTMDIYQYLGELYFNKKILNAYDIDEAKKLTFRQLYGGVEKQYEHIKYFNRLKGFVDTHWNFFCAHGFVETPIFQRRITTEHIKDPNPNKLFNYILQATETEIAIPVIFQLNHFLRKRQSKAILYTYDSVLFDFCRDDEKDTLQGIVEIMCKNNHFPIKMYVGNDYANLNQIPIS